ncbi:MAG: tyrosine/phenylalanine carboxypeptidase domain-containing protein [Candidatus Peregrinibacteria bacterium]
MWFFHNPGVLGINARNLLYIRAFNPKKAIMLADSKIKTKNFLSARGIPVARMYGAITNKKELGKFDWNSLPNSFVVKPNSGFGGEGIVIIKSRKGANWVDGQGKLITQEELINHVNDILEGRYSIVDLADAALFEELLVAPPPFDTMAHKGLPDIRVVVHNLIPVMAMLRLPSETSQGKANVHLGGIAVGIDIAKGELTHVIQHNKPINGVPGFGDVRGMKIPYWEDILLIASKTQQATNLGFAAVDLTLDKTAGPVLLEINARSGLTVQVANLAPLRKRLERIQGIKVATPEKGVRIAREIFGQKIELKAKEKTKENDKVVIGQFERLEVIGKKNNERIIAYIDPHLEKTVLDENVAKRIDLDKTCKCKFNLMDKRITTVVEVSDLSHERFKMIVGKRDLSDFLIDPSRNTTAKGLAEEGLAPIIKPIFTEEDLKKIDDEIVNIDSEIHLLSHLRPLNLRYEHTKFLADPSYDPQFEYKPLSFDPNNLHARLKRINFPDSPMGILWRKKADEIQRKICLLESRGTEHFTQQSIYLYGVPDLLLVKKALAEAARMPGTFQEPKATLSAKEAAKAFEEVIANYGLAGWRVRLKEDLVSDAVAGKQNTILIRADATFSEERLKGTIAHEIETHVFTAMNGAKQPYKIFQRGLAHYLMTEEGLAVYNQEKTESGETSKKYWPCSSVIGIYKALDGSFSDVYQEVLRYGFDADRAWRVALKAKRGLTDTSCSGAFTKDFVYFKGHRMILDFVRKGGDLRDLYYGKTNLEDLPLIKKVAGLKKPVFLPKYLQE